MGTDTAAPARRVKVIACEVLQREVCACAADSPLVLDLEFLPKGLHDLGRDRMAARIQEALDRVGPERHDRVILVYGLCNMGVEGLRCRVPMTIPRAHDCIALMLGSRARYREYFDLHPGTYFKSPGWIERDSDPSDASESVVSQLGISTKREEYVRLYGEENADFLMESLGAWMRHYDRLALIDTGVGDREAYRTVSRAAAEADGLAYDEIPGDLALLRRLLHGSADAGAGDTVEADFLTVPPGSTIAASLDDAVVRAAAAEVPAAGPSSGA